MKKYLLNILIFILPLLIFSYPLDLFLSKKLSKIGSNSFAYGECLVWNDLYESNIQSDVVIHGSSRAWVHIDPILLGDKLGRRVYNLGIDGHNFWLQYLRNKILLASNEKPKYLILSLDLFTLQKNATLYNYNQFLPFMLYNEEMKSYLDSYNWFTTLDFFVPLLRYQGNFAAINKPFKELIKGENVKENRVKGFRAVDRAWTMDFEKVKRDRAFYEVKLHLPSINLFDKFLRECKSDGIEVIFVYSPEYIEGQKFAKNRDEVLTLYQSFSEKYDILFLDYSNDVMCSETRYFYNALHLNKKGAELFTKKLANDLIKTDSQHGIYFNSVEENTQ